VKKVFQQAKFKENMEFLDIPLFDDDFFKMIFRFSLNLVFLILIIRYLYYKKSKKVAYLFTYFLIGIIVFFICFTLKKFEIDLGMALGLFAIFGIIRYRTDPIPIREMTYLFVVIGISIMNALVNKKMSYVEILSANTIIFVATYILENINALKHEVSKKITYDNMELVKKQNENLLLKDLEERTGLKINRVKVNSIDYFKPSANLTIYYIVDAEN
jgi:cell division protein FtsW (lipid II flippase)